MRSDNNKQHLARLQDTAVFNGFKEDNNNDENDAEADDGRRQDIKKNKDTNESENENNGTDISQSQNSLDSNDNID